MSSHILIVEDDEMVAAFIALHLEDDGHRISRAATGAEGLDVLARDSIDLVVLDLNLPDGDGLSIAQEIRTRSEVPIIILTARKGQDDKLMGLGLGADEYLTKPVDPQELFLRVHNLLGRAGRAAGTQARAAPVAPAAPAAPPAASVLQRRGLMMGAGLAVLVAVIAAGAAWWGADKGRQAAEQPKMTDDQPVMARNGDPDRLPEVQSDPPLSSTSYSWVLQSKCERVPYVSWWQARTRAEIVSYVNRRHTGSWKPYINDWTTRLTDLQESYSRGRGVRTPDGEVLIGETLRGHIEKTKKLLEIILCLSHEAAEYSHKKIQPPK